MCYQPYHRIWNLVKSVKEYCLSIQTFIFCSMGLVPSSLGLYSLFNFEEIQLNDEDHTIFKAYIALSLGFSIIVSFRFHISSILTMIDA